MEEGLPCLWITAINLSVEVALGLFLIDGDHHPLQEIGPLGGLALASQRGNALCVSRLGLPGVDLEALKVQALMDGLGTGVVLRLQDSLGAGT
jgi:hypothetical protein